MGYASLGAAAAGVIAAHGAKAEHSWARMEEQLEAISNDGPGAAAKLSQVRAALMQRARALEAQLRTASGALKGEEFRIERLSEQLHRSAEDRKRDRRGYIRSS